MRTDTAVLKHLTSRKLRKNDGRKIGLLLTGGGMSGVFSGGVAQVIEQKGLAECFDVCYSYSSGAPTGAYLLSGNTAEGSSIYWEDLSGVRFFQPWKPNHWMNVEHLVHVMSNVKPLDYNRIRQSEMTFYVQVTNTESGSVRMFSNHDQIDMRQLLRATCTFPGAASPVKIDGEYYCDGGVTDFITIDQLINDGCTDVLVVANLPNAHKRSSLKSGHPPQFLRPKGYGDQFIQKYAHMRQNYSDYIQHLFSDNLSNDVNIYILAPEYFVSPMTVNAKKLHEFEQHGVSMASSCFTDA